MWPAQDYLFDRPVPDPQNPSRGRPLTTSIYSSSGVERCRGTGHVLGLVLLVAVDPGLVQCIGENIYQTQCQGQLY